MVAERKLRKYEKVIKERMATLMSILKDFIKKKDKLEVPRHLVNMVEEGELLSVINIRKSQLFIKQLAYWVKKFHVELQTG